VKEDEVEDIQEGEEGEAIESNNDLDN